MSAFKLSESQKESIKVAIHKWVASRLEWDVVMDEIESIIQDRGNSIQDGWIDVEDMLPEIDTYVLVYSPFKIHTATHEAISEYSRYGFTSMARVTHWQPLPSAPKQPKK